MSKTLEYSGTFKPDLLWEEFQTTFPQYIDVAVPTNNLMHIAVYGGTRVLVTVPDNADEQAILTVITTHNPASLSSVEINMQGDAQAIQGFRNLPNYATWTPQESYDNTFNAIFNGANQATVDAQIDALPNTVAGMKTGLKALAAEIITIRLILANVLKMIAYLRNLVIKLR